MGDTPRDAAFWISKLALIKHPEGGHYRETYRAPMKVQGPPENFGGVRSASTAIYFLLSGDEFSGFHRNKADEVWHYYGGSSSLLVYEIFPDGELKVLRIGNNLEKGDSLQGVSPGGIWFGSRLENPRNNEEEPAFALVGCTVAPGFAFEDFEIAKREELVKQYPKHDKIITELTHL